MATDAAPVPTPCPFTQRRIALMPVWLLLSFNVYWVVWLYKTYREIRQHSSAATTITPGRAVGFLAIPLFNLYWFFRVVFDFPRALARVQAESSPGAPLLPSGRISGMLVAAIAINAIGSYRDPSILVAGEILLATALIVCQKAMNGHAHGPVTPRAEPSQTFAELIGVSGASIDWRPVAAFAFAAFASTLVRTPTMRALLGLEVAWGAGQAAVMAVLAAGAAVVAFRFVRNEWLAALLGAALYAAGTLAASRRFEPTEAAVNLGAQFLLYAGLALFLRLVPSLWLAVLLGYAFAEFGDNLAVLFYGGARFSVFQPLLDAQTTVVFTGALWLAHKLLVRR